MRKVSAKVRHNFLPQFIFVLPSYQSARGKLVRLTILGHSLMILCLPGSNPDRIDVKASYYKIESGDQRSFRSLRVCEQNLGTLWHFHPEVPDHTCAQVTTSRNSARIIEHLPCFRYCRMSAALNGFEAAGACPNFRKMISGGLSAYVSTFMNISPKLFS